MERDDRPRLQDALKRANRGDVVVHNMEELQADLEEWLAEYNRTRQVPVSTAMANAAADLLGFALLGAGQNAGLAGAPSADAEAYPEQRRRGCGRLTLTQ